RDVFDANGRLVSPQFAESHIHLDYANTAGKPRINQSGTLFEAIEIWADRKAAGLNNADEIRSNAVAAARSAVSHGVGFIRSHVDVTDPDLTALGALLGVKKEIRDWCDLQIVAFPQNGIIAFPHGRELMERAMAEGADVVGGIPHLEPTREDGVESLKFVFDLAEKYGALVDVHCDEIDDPHSRFVEVMAAEAKSRSMQGRVTISHAVAMAYYSPGYMARLLPKLVDAGVRFAVCPNENLQLQGRDFGAPTPRGVAPIRTLTEWGIPVALCQDSISDPWYPVGEGNPLRILDSGLHVAHMLTGEYLHRCLDFITVNPAGNLGVEDYGVDVGKAANFLVLDATSDMDAVQHDADVLLSIHGGREVFRKQPAKIEWAL
ncbi:MAG: amidohydrolase family protein, partial [Myxococcaceae bacterium]